MVRSDIFVSIGPVMNKISIPQLLIEFVSVVFAVLLALGLNSYKQRMDARQDARNIKASILTECRENLRKVDSVLKNNGEYSEYLDSLIQLDPEAVTGVAFAYNFELLTSSAWEFAQNNPAVNNIEQQFILDAADIYQALDFYTDFATSFFKNMSIFLSQQNQLREYDMALAMYYSIGTMNNSATDIQEMLNDFLEDYGKDTNGEQ